MIDKEHNLFSKHNKIKAIDNFCSAYKDQNFEAAIGAMRSGVGITEDYHIDRWILNDVYWMLQHYKKEILKDA